MKARACPNGYMWLSLRSATNTNASVFVHRAVASAWLDDFDTPGTTVHHINRCRTDNRLENLRMATHQEQALEQCKDNAGKGLQVPIAQYTLDGTLVKIHPSITDAMAAIGMPRYVQSVAECLKGTRTDARGFRWTLPPHEDLESEQWREFGNALVSNKGRVRRLLRHGIYAPAKAARDLCRRGGYPVVYVSGKGRHLLHRVVARLFLDPPGDPTRINVNHIDGDKTNAAADNLDWATQRENVQHAVRTGLITTTKAVEQYAPDGRLMRTYASISEASRSTGVCLHNISRVLRGLGKTANGFVWKYA